MPGPASASTSSASRDPDGGEELLAIKDLEGLIALVQASVLEIHVWGAKLGNIERPDGITFDLDPDAEVAWSRRGRRRLRGARPAEGELGLAAFVKTTGGKGLHVFAPLKPHADWAAVKEFAHGARQAPWPRTARNATWPPPRRRRAGGRIFVDYLRNGRGATAVAAYSAAGAGRARRCRRRSAGTSWARRCAPIGSPCTNLLHRLAKSDDPWRDVRKQARRLPS